MEVDSDNYWDEFLTFLLLKVVYKAVTPVIEGIFLSSFFKENS